ncbi:MAG: helix-hairpin-helix domain-containing protein, partial [Acutalibacteraceae bacterium]|nr:helix-hairpin-helix domain-containing protein [Acutalibacteraceae bacterium]
MGEVFSGEAEKLSVMFSRCLYPKAVQPGYKGYMICMYRIYDPGKKTIPKSAGGEGFNTITAVGENLPIIPKINYILTGNWQQGKRGPQFKVVSHDLPTLDTEEGIVGFLTCGSFKGMSQRIAKKIYRVHGKDTIRICDEDIDKLSKIPGFSARNFEKFKESYALQMGCKRLLKLLSPFRVNGKQVQRFYNYFGDEDVAIDTLKANPYRLCGVSNVSFRVADEIAKEFKLDPQMPDRIREAALYALREQEALGNTCCSGKTLCESVCKICEFRATKEIRNVILPPLKYLVDKGV